MYIKQTDGAGFPSIRIFAFTEQTAQAFKNADNYVTRDEFDEILKVIDQLKGATRYGEQPVSGKK